VGTLNGKVALVTGGSRGIGAEIAKRLAFDGAAVAITFSGSRERGQQVVNEITTIGGRGLAIQADSGDPSAVKLAVARTVEEFGRLDILVNNAGIAAMAPIAEFPEDEFERMLSINVRGVFYATKEAVKHMGEGGRVIMIGSVNSESVPFQGGSAYALTKGAVASFVRGLARDLGPRGITVNNVQPGPVDTEMNPHDGPFSATLKGYLAIGRYAKGEEIAGLVAYLASAEAGNITSAMIRIDGGFAA
jgi:3-oxoacyl-[acyl-carrier protein] reductase